MAVLVFTRATAYVHDSTPAGVAAIAQLVPAEATEDPGAFTAANLARYAGVVFLNTSGTVLDTQQKAALLGYVRGGGGFAGVHGAANTEFDWPDYVDLVGAWFHRHPQLQPATVEVEDPDHPATTDLPRSWAWTDEWYDFLANPRSRVHVLATVDERTYAGGGMGADHPVAWCRPYGAGRAFYTALGHSAHCYTDPVFRAHLAGGIRWACEASARNERGPQRPG